MKDGSKFKLSELVTNKQYRAIMILVFYFFFFVIIIIGVRTALNNKEANGDSTEQRVVRKLKGFSSIKSANFNYKYTLNIDDKIYIYEGKKYGDKDSFTLTIDKDIRKYLQIGDFTFEVKGKDKVLTDKPVYYLDFFSVDVLEQIIKNSTLKSENVYSIDNKTLDSVLKLALGVNNRLENSIMATYEEGIITRIDIDYTNYIRFTNSNIRKVLLTLEYKSFGEVADFEVKSDSN